MHRISRLILLVGLAACAGGTQTAGGPDPVEAQDAQSQKSNSQVKMPPAIAMNTLGIAGQVVGVLPITLVVARDSLAGKPPFANRASSLRWADSIMGEMMMLRAPDVKWKLPDQMRAVARSAPGMAADPDYLGQAALRDPQITNVPNPMISNIRNLMAIAGGRYAFVPASLSFQHDSLGRVEARGNFAGVDTRMGDVVFRSYIIATGATPAAAMDSVMAVLFPSVTIDP